jgi:hypothetical protein
MKNINEVIRDIIQKENRSIVEENNLERHFGEKS